MKQIDQGRDNFCEYRGTGFDKGSVNKVLCVGVDLEEEAQMSLRTSASVTVVNELIALYRSVLEDIS